MALDVAFAVPATTAVRATVPSNPGRPLRPPRKTMLISSALRRCLSYLERRSDCGHYDVVWDLNMENYLATACAGFRGEVSRPRLLVDDDCR